MSIEDGEAFRLFQPTTTVSDVGTLLKLIDGHRRSRTAEVLAKTRETHDTISVAERLAMHQDFYYDCSGLQDAMRESLR